MNQFVPILLYHSISERVSSKFSPWAVSPNHFAEHMAYLNDQGYTPVTVSQFAAELIARENRLPERPVVITFDDGLDDFYTNALPILKNYSFFGTLYIVTGFVGRTSRWLEKEGEGGRQMLSWDKIREIDASGIECGAHSHTHPELDTLSLATAREEIVLSKNILEKHLSKKVKSFAYPHGYHNNALRQLLMAVGYTSGCAVKHAMSSLADDRFALARIIIKSDTQVDVSLAMVSSLNRHGQGVWDSISH
jgi:peptidoglycan/xylan/chitin deacetylase (PgdA/CDA1 family)